MKFRAQTCDERLPRLDIQCLLVEQPRDLINGCGVVCIPEIVSRLPDLAGDEEGDAVVFEEFKLVLEACCEPRGAFLFACGLVFLRGFFELSADLGHGVCDFVFELLDFRELVLQHLRWK